jgi:DNA N-6-adenine-methyltransferase (Dam)
MAISKVLYSSNKTEYQTPRHLFEKLHKEFCFDLDPCTTEHNPLGTKYFMTEQINGLAQSRDFAKSVYINPPYNREIKNG